MTTPGTHIMGANKGDDWGKVAGHAKDLVLAAGLWVTVAFILFALGVLGNIFDPSHLIGYPFIALSLIMFIDWAAKNRPNKENTPKTPSQNGSSPGIQ